MTNQKLLTTLLSWPLRYIRDAEIAVILKGSPDRRYGIIKRALQGGLLVHIRRGLYTINAPYNQETLDTFELAQQVYGPSYISLESALSYHGWIPEAVYIVTSVTPKRSATFHTPVGTFLFKHTPQEEFFRGVKRITFTNTTYLMAEPWKAIADHYYVYRRPWNTLKDVCSDLRIEPDVVGDSDLALLNRLSQYYPSPRVRKLLTHIYRNLADEP